MNLNSIQAIVWKQQQKAFFYKAEGKKEHFAPFTYQKSNSHIRLYMPFVNTYIYITYIGTYLKRPSWCDVLCKCHCTFSVLIVIADQMNIYQPRECKQKPIIHLEPMCLPLYLVSLINNQVEWKMTRGKMQQQENFLAQVHSGRRPSKAVEYD